jgi:hypothetical protein
MKAGLTSLFVLRFFEDVDNQHLTRGDLRAATVIPIPIKEPPQGRILPNYSLNLIDVRISY